MVVLSDKTDYGSFSAEPSAILVVSGTGGDGTTNSSVVTNRHPTTGSIHSSSQSLSVHPNSTYGVHSSNNNIRFSGSINNDNGVCTQSNTSITPSLTSRGKNPNLGVSLALGLGLVNAANSGVNVLSTIVVSESQGTRDNNSKSVISTGYSNSSSPMSTNSGDLLFQRQPLLQECNNGWGGLTDDHESSHSDDTVDEKRNGSAVRIDIPPLRDSDTDQSGVCLKRYPKEKRKTAIAFVFLFCNFILATLSLALTHERLPDRKTYKPLPDIVLDNVNVQDWALDVSEILIIVSTAVTFLVMIFHKHRWIVFRRAFMILGILYLMRSITMYVTVLPVASYTYFCSPKENSTSFLLVAKRVIQLVSGFGLSINGQQTYCGDYIYSGHTVILVTAYLIISEYTPKKLYLLHWASCLASWTGIVMVLIARGHYTIDVLVAYYATTRILCDMMGWLIIIIIANFIFSKLSCGDILTTTRVFWIYHTLAHNPQLKNASTTNFLSRIWWFPLFKFFEGNVGGVLPKQFSCPWTKPHRSRRSI